MENKYSTSGNVIVCEKPIFPIVDFDESVKKVLHVNWDSKEGFLDFTIYPVELFEFGEWRSNNVSLKSEVERYLGDLNNFLNEVVIIGDPSIDVWKSICFNLETKGKLFFDTLIPVAVSEEVKKWPKDSTIMISTNEQWIPWELIHDGNDFWGNKFIISRLPRIPNRKLLKGDRPIFNGVRNVKNILNVIGGGIPDIHLKEASEIFCILPENIRVDNIVECPISVLKENLELIESDIIQYTCHGYLNPPLLQISSKHNLYENLAIDNIASLRISPGCFVFVNSCSSSVTSITFSKFNSFGWEFYLKGASVFIGTLGQIPVKYAIQFAKSVFRHLYDNPECKNIGEAVKNARNEAKQNRNIFWLLYSLYGNPETKFSF